MKKRLAALAVAAVITRLQRDARQQDVIWGNIFLYESVYNSPVSWATYNDVVAATDKQAFLFGDYHEQDYSRKQGRRL